MGRSVKKGPFVAPELIKRVIAMNETGEKKVLKTWSRASTIFPEFVGHTIAAVAVFAGHAPLSAVRAVLSDADYPDTGRQGQQSEQCGGNLPPAARYPQSPLL